jgi:hypothetical protein
MPLALNIGSLHLLQLSCFSYYRYCIYVYGAFIANSLRFMEISVLNTGYSAVIMLSACLHSILFVSSHRVWIHRVGNYNKDYAKYSRAKAGGGVAVTGLAYLLHSTFLPCFRLQPFSYEKTYSKPTHQQAIYSSRQSFHPPLLADLINISQM